jgi:hypothetical protein
MNLNALVPWRNATQTPSTRDNVYDPFVSLRREMDRMFDRFFDGLPGRSSNGWDAITPRH